MPDCKNIRSLLLQHMPRERVFKIFKLTKNMFPIICFILLVSISRGLCREAMCSSFHYEEKLLEKMIRQEIHVEQMENKVEKALQSISTFMADIEQKMNTMAADIEQKLNTKTIEINSEINESLNKVSTITDNMKTTMDAYKEAIKEERKELQTLSDKVTVPRIAFSAYYLKDRSVAATYGSIFIFTSLLFNEGDGYDSNTGVFTAPVGGLYYFTVNVCNFPKKFVFYGINVDGNTVAGSTHYDADTYACNSLSTVTLLNTGSTVSVRSTYTNSNNQAYHDNSHRRMTFNGVLLHT